MLIDKIKEDLDNARKKSLSKHVGLLSTLYSECVMVGKNKGNRPSTDEEVVQIVKKFISGCEEMSTARALRGESNASETMEIMILAQYLPKQLSPLELEDIISIYVGELPDQSPKMVGKIMAELKATYSGQYDGKLASEIAKRLLNA